jgi:16S rRNA (cytidine1402-2'-O)-methyltransferase
MPGILYIVATPIGNLKDVSERAKNTLVSVDAILCEDTRVTKKLLNHLGIKKELISYHQHSSQSVVTKIHGRLKQSQNLALVTDAGTPGISDPGGKLVESLREDVEIVPIPGPCALITALSVSGFPSDKFRFLGFPPNKKGRKKFFEELDEIQETIVFYESTHRIEKALESLLKICPKRRLVIARELTKMHETIYRGHTENIIKQLEATSKKGEFVVVLAPKKYE